MVRLDGAAQAKCTLAPRVALYLYDTIGPYAERLGSGALLGHAHALAERNGAQRQRTAAEDGNGDLHPLVAWLADRYERPLEQGA